MKRPLRLYKGLCFVAVAVVLGAGASQLERRAAAQGSGSAQAPMFEVDPLWPKPLPNNWVLGNAIGITVDAKDNIWMIHRTTGLPDNFKLAGATCCTVAPAVLGFDQAGNLIGSWGGPGTGYEWPQSNHGVTIDYKGNFWLGGNGAKDTQVLKFAPGGKFLLQIGKQGAALNSNDTANLGRPAEVTVDQAANETYVADGYGNRRVIVFDADSGQYKRHWGAYGSKPDDTDPGPYNPDGPAPKQFRTPVHCAEISNDNFVYVCDRANDRIQVFRKDGTFVKEAFFAKTTRGAGAVWDIAFSRDPKQTYLYVADGGNHNVRIVLRDTLTELTTIGTGGQGPGQFYGTHNLITDTRGNLYVAETYGARIQKFAYKGVGPVKQKDQGAVWPRSTRK